MKRRSFLAMLGLAPGVAVVSAASEPAAGVNPDVATAVQPPFTFENGQFTLNPVHVRPLIEKMIGDYDRNVLPARLDAAVRDPRARG